MRKNFLIIFVMAFAFVLSGCRTTSAENTFTIGYVANNLNDTFQTYLLSNTIEAAEKNGMMVNVQDAQEDLIQQQDIANSFLVNEVDALVVVPVDTSAMQPITDAAVEAGVPIVYLNRNPLADQAKETIPDDVYYVGTDEKMAGILQVEYAAEQTDGKGGIGIIMGILGNQGAMQRTEGILETVEENYPEMEVLAVESAEWQRDQAITLTENWLETYGDRLNIILANNDEMALGALQATEKTNNDYIVTGVDGLPDGLAAVENGILDATVYQDSQAQGQQAIGLLTRLRDGETIDESIHLTDFELITQENVHLYQD